MQVRSACFMTVKVLIGLVILGILSMFLIGHAGLFLWGYLPHLLTLALLFDIYRKRLPKKLLPIIILLYGAYYAFYFYEAIIIHATENKVIAENKKDKIIFDPSKQVLIMQGGKELVIYNKLPVIYENNKNFPEEHLSYRLISSEKCQKISNIKRETFDFNIQSVKWHQDDNLFDAITLGQCQLRTPEKPPKDVLTISRKEDTESTHGINFLSTIYTINSNQQILGTIKTVKVARMPAFPFFIVGCGFFVGSGVSWECGAHLQRFDSTLQNADQGTVNKYGNHPVAIALKLEKYKETDFSSFKDYAENISFIDNWLNKKRNETQNDFNEWGFQKDNPYLPKIRIKNGIEYYTGVIYAGKEGSPFQQFIQRNIGKTVFIDATLHQSVALSMNSFSVAAVCREENTCRRIDNSYVLLNDGTPFLLYGSRHVKGFWEISKTAFIKDAEDPRGDTSNSLILKTGVIE